MGAVIKLNSLYNEISNIVEVLVAVDFKDFCVKTIVKQ